MAPYDALKEKYGVEIRECRPKINIVQSARKHGIPFVSKIMSGGLSEWQKKGVPLSIADEYEQAEDKAAKRTELVEEYNQKFMNPYVAAERGYVDEVITPEETRSRIISALKMLENKQRVPIDKKHGNIPL